MRVAASLLGLTYPLIVYLGLTRFDIRHVAVAIVLLAGVRLAASLRSGTGAPLRAAALPFALAGLVAGGAAWLDDARIFLLVPVFVNAALLAGFARSLWRGPPVIETFARLQVGDLSAPEVAHCRTVTAVWVGFFAVNGGLALGLALFASLEAWTLYNGLVAYLLVAILFTSEFVYRTWRFRRYRGGLWDPVFRRIFPPRQPS